MRSTVCCPLQIHGCCIFSPTKLHFCPEFSYHSPFFLKNNASYSGILLAQVTCPEAIEISRVVFIIDMGGEETDTIDG
jgi:hypothetical protein